MQLPEATKKSCNRKFRTILLGKNGFSIFHVCKSGATMMGDDMLRTKLIERMHVKQVITADLSQHCRMPFSECAPKKAKEKQFSC